MTLSRCETPECEGNYTVEFEWEGLDSVIELGLLKAYCVRCDTFRQLTSEECAELLRQRPQ